MLISIYYRRWKYETTITRYRLIGNLFTDNEMDTGNEIDIFTLQSFYMERPEFRRFHRPISSDVSI